MINLEEYHKWAEGQASVCEETGSRPRLKWNPRRQG